MKKTFLFSFLFFFTCSAFAQEKAKNLVMITIDGCRWKEVFHGADSVLLYDKKFMKKYAGLVTSKYAGATAAERREKLMPFLWKTIAKEGSLYGNRDFDNNVQVENPYNISCPGYSEIYTGYADPAIKNNDLILNPNPNVLEYINKQEGFKGKVVSFVSWDRAPYYLNEARSGFMVNGGYEAVTGEKLSPVQKTLNEIQATWPYMISESSRPDILTYYQAKEYMRINHPRVISLGFAYTDDMAHDGNYGFYLDEIHAFDKMIGDLWTTLQADPMYKGTTTIMITVDHGRGDGDEWTSHGPSVKRANEIWFAGIGPGIQAKGEVKTPASIYQSQLAQTAAHLLGLNFTSSKTVGPAIKEIIDLKK